MDLSAAAVVEENDAFKQKTAELSLHLREVANYTKIQPALISQNPHDEKVWIEYANLQDSLLIPGKPALARVISEKKLDIYSKSLDNNPYSVELCKAYMALLTETKEPTEVLEKWDSVLQKFPSNAQFRKMYIEYRMSLYSFFCVSDVEEVFQESLSQLTETKLNPGIYYTYLSVVNCHQKLKRA